MGQTHGHYTKTVTQSRVPRHNKRHSAACKSTWMCQSLGHGQQPVPTLPPGSGMAGKRYYNERRSERGLVVFSLYHIGRRGVSWRPRIKYLHAP